MEGNEKRNSLEKKGRGVGLIDSKSISVTREQRGVEHEKKRSLVENLIERKTKQQGEKKRGCRLQKDGGRRERGDGNATHGGGSNPQTRKT